MKTQVRLNNSLTVVTLSLPPDRTIKALEKHFNTTWGELYSRGLSVYPPPNHIRNRSDIIAECTEPDGSVWGVRFFNLCPPGYIMSPTSQWIWETATQVVPHFSNAEAVRGYHGFHAAWPEDLQDWIGSDVDHPATKCKALVKGFGDVVLGDMGFRSSKMTILQCCVREDDPLLRKRYPSVEFRSTSAPFLPEEQNIEELWYIPHDVRRIAKWLREKSLKSLANEF